MRALRYFYRCADCLGVAATETAIEPAKDAHGWPVQPARLNAECGACAGRLEFMGEVYKQRLNNLVGYLCACDGKCTGAVGPSCDCQCGGENHGTGRVVPIITTGPIPRLMIPPDASQKALAYRALCDQFKAAWDARYRSLTERKRYDRLDAGEFRRYLEGQHTWATYSKARTGRTHAGRNKKLGALIEALKNTSNYFANSY